MRSKKFVLKKDTLPYVMLQAIKENWKQNSDLCEIIVSSKQRVNYWLRKLEKECLIERFAGGIYEITWSGKELLRTYELENTKKLIRLENMRYKCPIHEGVEKVFGYSWLTPSDLKNIRVYRGVYEGFNVTIFAGSKNPSLEITCTKHLGTDIYEMMHKARSEIDMIAQIIATNMGLKLGMIEPSMEPEWAIPSPMAEVILEKTCSSQISTPKGLINRSKGRNADLETRDIRLAHEIFIMPERIRKITESVEEMKSMLSKMASESITDKN